MHGQVHHQHCQRGSNPVSTNASQLVADMLTTRPLSSIVDPDGSSQPQTTQFWLNTHPSASSQPSLSSQPPSTGSSMTGSTASQWATQADALSQFRGSRMSSKVRAHAFITLGKSHRYLWDILYHCFAFY